MEVVKLLDDPNINEKIVEEKTRLNTSLISEDDVQLIEEHPEVIVIESDSEPELLIKDNSIPSTTETSVSLVVGVNENKIIKKKKRKKVSNKSHELNLAHEELKNKLEVYLMKQSSPDIIDIEEFHKVKDQLNIHAINSTHDGRWTHSLPKNGELLQIDSMDFTANYIKIMCANTSTAKWLKFLKCSAFKNYRLVFK